MQLIASPIFSPYVIIADFEADNKKCWSYYGDIIKPMSYSGNMKKYSEQRANSFCYIVHWIDTGETWEPFIYQRPDATQEFVRRIDNELQHINQVFENKADWIITKEYQDKFNNASTCWICNKEFCIDETLISKLKKNIDFITIKLKVAKKDSEEYTIFSKLLLKYNKKLNIEENRYLKV